MGDIHYSVNLRKLDVKSRFVGTQKVCRFDKLYYNRSVGSLYLIDKKVLSSQFYEKWSLGTEILHFAVTLGDSRLVNTDNRVFFMYSIR